MLSNSKVDDQYATRDVRLSDDGVLNKNAATDGLLSENDADYENTKPHKGIYDLVGAIVVELDLENPNIVGVISEEEEHRLST